MPYTNMDKLDFHEALNFYESILNKYNNLLETILFFKILSFLIFILIQFVLFITKLRLVKLAIVSYIFFIIFIIVDVVEKYFRHYFVVLERKLVIKSRESLSKVDENKKPY